MRQVNKDEFVRVCIECQTMAQAAQRLNFHFNTFKRYAEEFGCYCPNQGRKGIKTGKKATRYKTEDILHGKYPEYQSNKLRIRLLEEGYKEHKCECCGLSEWNGKPIPLELHHKDGNSHNHILSNLILLCLNCHAQTDTFRSKNDKSKIIAAIA